MSDCCEILERAAELVPKAADQLVADPILHRAQKRVGTTLRDKWKLDALLGVGAAAAVYAATHRNGSRGAVKILHPEMAANAMVREGFLWEGYVANAVGHDGVIKVIDDDTAEDGSLFLVTELLDGETLEERRVRLGGRIPQEEVLLVADQLLSVLAAAHAKGVVHRDLKPENVFLTCAGQLKVLDFGIARLSELSTESLFSQNGMVVGTPAYMAPEQARGLSDEVDAQSDLWACGAMMFVLLSGQSVQEGSTVNDQLVNAITKKAWPLASVAPDVEASIACVVDRALESSKEMRWPNASDMREAVERAYEGLYGHPIANSARLTPTNGAARGLPPGALQVVPKQPDVVATVRPVVLTDAPGRQAQFRQRRWGTAALGGIVALGIGLPGIVWIAGEVRLGAHLHATSVAALIHAASAPSQPRNPSPPSTPPVMLSLAPLSEFDLRILPDVSPSMRKPGRGTGRRTYVYPPQPPSSRPTNVVAGPAPSGSAIASTFTDTALTERQECRPPYVIDAVTGNKRWILGCL